jgi:hypothetical protein
MEKNPDIGSRRDLAENAAQLVKIHRLRQMEIESSFSAALDVVTRSKARYRHGFHRPFSFRFHDDIVPIPVWQGDITQHKRRNSLALIMSSALRALSAVEMSWPK